MRWRPSMEGRRRWASTFTRQARVISHRTKRRPSRLDCRQVFGRWASLWTSPRRPCCGPRGRWVWISPNCLLAPGACDNGAGVAGMLAIAHALIQAQTELAAPLIFLGNVGEEGEGDLRGVRFLYRSEEHTSELQSLRHLVCRVLRE